MLRYYLTFYEQYTMNALVNIRSSKYYINLQGMDNSKSNTFVQVSHLYKWD